MKFLLLFIALSLSAVAATRPSEDNITRDFAKMRRAQIKDVKYNLSFDLAKNQDTYSGKAIIHLTLNDLTRPLSLDWKNKAIQSLQVNGVTLTDYPKREGSFDVPAKFLAPKTLITVFFIGEYSKEASGFQRAKDPEDGSEYVYTDFEPYYAHWFFPCFDQPDLKATFEVNVTAPIDWKVIQNEMIVSENVVNGKKYVAFKETKPMSTYLFFLGAGPFVEWKDKYGDIPLYLYTRKSLEKYVDADNIMETTKKGLKFFNDYFGYPYPFTKYAHVFVPEFAWGGMENPGAVTMNERNIFRGPVPEIRYDKRNSLILHEMAHMWFGDLVTMEWWNDLWLNESFASYLASVAQDRALGAKDTWIDFFHGKTWGYWQDSLITTHPIETDVPDVRTARGNFDGITYAKGASALKQLHFFAGEEGFRDGLRDYFKTFAFKNTRREDFIRAIAKASKVDLTAWTKSWLQTAGPHKVALAPECKDGKLEKILITQKPNASKAFSPHRAKLAFFDRDFKQFQSVDVTFEKEETEIPFQDTRCPTFILPNEGDQDYALYSLDEASLKLSIQALTKLPDPLTRLMVWHQLSQMVRNSELKARAFMESAILALKMESDDQLLGSLLGRHSFMKQTYQWYLTPAERAATAPEFEKVIWDRMTSAKPKSSAQMSFYDYYVGMAQTKESQERLHSILIKNEPPKGMTLDQDRRWAIILNLSINGHTDAEKLINEELKRDGSTLGKRTALAARSAIPTKANKSKMWTELFENKDFTYSDLEEAGRTFNGVNYPELTQIFVKDFFKRLSNFDWKLQDKKSEIYFENLFPFNLCAQEVLTMSEKHMKSAKKLTGLAKRGWMEAQDELARCVKVRKFSTTN
ncbi:aminopeptidase N [Peredibacter sp. HCB2-198]|uniref:aminopeptidase N n=1 Tax=Peredibacter sp. HCB2-198 TaxID=3383025 RepID=UPI0038B51075